MYIRKRAEFDRKPAEEKKGKRRPTVPHLIPFEDYKTWKLCKTKLKPRFGTKALLMSYFTYEERDLRFKLLIRQDFELML